MAAKDPYRYFRIEARELLSQLGEGLLALERGGQSEGPDGAADTRAVVARLLRLAHTLKGAASVVRQPAIAAQAHAVEDVLTPLRDGAARASREQIDTLLQRCDEIAQGVAALDPVPAAAVAAAASAGPLALDAPAAAAEIPQLAPEELDTLLASVDHTQAHLAGLRQSLALAQAARKTLASGDPERLAQQLQGIERLLDSSLHQLGRELMSVRDHAEQLRLLPAARLFLPLQRAARDAAQSLGRPLNFDALGGNVRLEAGLLNAVQGALMQMLRNAIAHGIESPERRLAAGKPAAGRITLNVERRGSQVLFSCSDDGAGIDLESVRAAALARGHAGAPTLDEAGLLALLLQGGLSTAAQVDSLAGRGVGLDLVRDTAERLGGRLSIQTERNFGTTLELALPLQLAALRVLAVEAGGQRVYLPLEAVKQVLGQRELAGASLVLNGELLPHAPLARALRAGPEANPVPPCTLIIAAGDDRAGIAVDALHGVSSIVLRPPPALLPVSPLVAGVAGDADQQPRLVLDPEGLIAFARQAPPRPPAPAPAPPLVLIVDDSLTTRMLEQSILESAGYTVHTAASAEEGLEAARRQAYALFLVDIEMPGMDGFEFVARTRADPALRSVPAMLVSSLDAPESKQRGVEVGASGYIVKGEFAQQAFLDQVHALIQGRTRREGVPA